MPATSPVNNTQTPGGGWHRGTTNAASELLGAVDGIAAGYWLGIELKEATGLNNGTINHHSYFKTGAKRGLFVRPATVAKVLPDLEAQAAKDALHGPISTVCPASHLRTQPQCVLYLDNDSASLL